ncbi:hypothetical protein F53441_2576 [Fusarium austroafricanum]|uniref:Uncharacterized protein n=1 Tax=Fusarium austroafricanum TaxID=2364996 RepID=A0A8H4KRS5_9HYPO|nr:hypothetical protein F53441_2576 [Fusarium austroafricanum]
MSIENFPSLTPEEFSEACHHLDRQYCQASLGPQRARWKLRLCNALCTDFAYGGGSATYIQIRRPLEFDLDHGDLSLDLDGFSFSDDKKYVSISGDKDMLDAEEADKAALIRQRARPEVAMVEYEIHLHPTYRVPCLWFNLRNLPADEPAFDVDTVFRRLVPDEYKVGLRALGNVGGISADGLGIVKIG